MSEATKELMVMFSDLILDKTPSLSSKLLPTNALGSSFLLKTKQHCFQGEGGGGEGRNWSATKFRKYAPQVCNFVNSFVQHCTALK